MKLKVVKLEPYPREFPTSKAVGFNFTLENGRMFYLDTTVGLDLSDSEAIDSAYLKVREDAIAKRDELKNLPSLLGQEWDVEVEETEESEETEELEEIEEIDTQE